MHNKVLEYISLKRQAMDVIAELRDEENIYIQEHRKLRPGDKVEIWDGIKNRFYAEGIIGGCKNGVSMRLNGEIIDAKELSTEEDFDKRRSEFVYEVFVAKKDGTQSSKHMFHYPHYMKIDTEAREFEDYVIKIK